MNEADFQANVNFCSIVSKLRAFESVLTDEQREVYERNVREYANATIQSFADRMDDDQVEDFRALVLATL